MPEPPFPDRWMRGRLAEIERLRLALDAASQAGRAACDAKPELAADIAPLLTRLDEIREEIARLESSRTSPPAGELYPFWTHLARFSDD